MNDRGTIPRKQMIAVPATEIRGSGVILTTLSRARKTTIDRFAEATDVGFSVVCPPKEAISLLNSGSLPIWNGTSIALYVLSTKEGTVD